MAQPRTRTTYVADVEDLKASVKEVFPEVLGKLEIALKSEPRIFPSGIELIKLTLKVGTNIEFSLVIAGKDAPKVEQLASMSEQAFPARGEAREARAEVQKLATPSGRRDRAAHSASQ